MDFNANNKQKAKNIPANLSQFLNLKKSWQNLETDHKVPSCWDLNFFTIRHHTHVLSHSQTQKGVYIYETRESSIFKDSCKLVKECLSSCDFHRTIRCLNWRNSWLAINGSHLCNCLISWLSASWSGVCSFSVEDKTFIKQADTFLTC